MSYSRWSNSSWYSFYNVNGRLSLWYDMEHTTDWDHAALIDIMSQDPEKTAEFFKEFYTCSLSEAKEAMTYINMYLEDYDPEVGKEYDNEVAAAMAKWKEEDES
jgi:hypothetical protein